MSDPPVDALSSVPLFDALSPSKRQQLIAASRVRRYPKGQVLCSEGDPGDDLFVLEEGRVRICRFAPNGQEIVLAEAAAPAAFGELALLDGAPRAATVIADSAVQVRYLHRQAVLDLLYEEPAVAVAMLRSMATMVRATNERLGDILALDVPGRLAKWLLAHAGADARLVLDQSQEELARSIGTTRVTVNRLLHQFARGGLIEMRDHQVRILDPEALRDLTAG